MKYVCKLCLNCFGYHATVSSQCLNLVLNDERAAVPNGLVTVLPGYFEVSFIKPMEQACVPMCLCVLLGYFPD